MTPLIAGAALLKSFVLFALKLFMEMLRPANYAVRTHVKQVVSVVC